MALSAFLLLISISTTCFAQSNLSSDELLAIRLKSARTELERIALLNDSQYVFDFTAFANNSSLPGVTASNGGVTVAAIPTNFPALIGHGIAMTVGFIAPCGINLPHTHPRATEINIIIAGSFRAGFFLENGARFIGHNLTSGMMTIFPQGSIHFEQNLECQPATFVAAFNSEDPGVQTTTLSYFGLPSDIAAVGIDANASFVEQLSQNLVQNPALGVMECRQRCGL